MRATEEEAGMPVMGVAADILAMEAVAEKPVWGAAEAADMPERVAEQAVAGEPSAVESLSSAGFDRPGQRSDYMMEPPQFAAGLLVSVSGFPEAEPRLRVAEERRILPLPRAFSGDPGREQTSARSAEGVSPLRVGRRRGGECDAERRKAEELSYLPAR
jgi:hypothetical protein